MVKRILSIAISAAVLAASSGPSWARALFVPAKGMKVSAPRIGRLAPVGRFNDRFGAAVRLNTLSGAALPGISIPVAVQSPVAVSPTPVPERIFAQSEAVEGILSGRLEGRPMAREVFGVLTGEQGNLSGGVSLGSSFEGGEGETFYGKPAGDSIRQAVEAENEARRFVPKPKVSRAAKSQGSRLGAAFRGVAWVAVAFIGKVRSLLMRSRGGR